MEGLCVLCGRHLPLPFPPFFLSPPLLMSLHGRHCVYECLHCRGTHYMWAWVHMYACICKSWPWGVCLDHSLPYSFHQLLTESRPHLFSWSGELALETLYHCPLVFMWVLMMETCFSLCCGNCFSSWATSAQTSFHMCFLCSRVLGATASSVRLLPVLHYSQQHPWPSLPTGAASNPSSFEKKKKNVPRLSSPEPAGDRVFTAWEA